MKIEPAIAPPVRRNFPRPGRRRSFAQRTALAALVWLAGLAAAVALPGHAVIDDLNMTEAPAATPVQSGTLRLINYLLDKYHYREQPLDDDFSASVLRSYIDRLDPGKSIFMQPDIDQFERLHNQFDDFIRTGNLKPAFAIFSILRLRVEQRVEYALERLNAPFDFTPDEQYLFNREEAQWAGNIEELDDLWRKRIKNDILNLRLTGREEDITGALKQRYTHLARRIRQFNSEDVFQTFVNAYVNAIDPHTSYFSPRAGENFQINLSLSLEGIGAVLQADYEYTKIRRVIPGGPADIAGELKAEDRIVGIAQGDGEIVDVVGWRLDDVVALIRGPKASVVRLEILPGENDPDSHTRVISIQRDKINLEEQAAKKRTLQVETRQGKSTIGVIDLPSFYIDFNGLHKKAPDYRSTTRDVRKLLDEFRRERIDGLVIDLRGNGGGALTEAVSLTGLFIRQGPVVQVQSAGDRIQIDRDPDPEIIYDGPLVVLVDRHSASASEIFAGAVQDYRRGLIIGEPTYGKGTVQNLLHLNRYAKSDHDLGQLKITIAQFFRINGDSTQHRGVIPDIIWPATDSDDQFGERAHENAMPWRRIGNASFQYFQDALAPAVFAQIRDWHARRVHENPEFQYFLDAKKMSDERRDKNLITLNETARKRERTERDNQQLELENRKRRALGREVAASIKTLNREHEEQSRAAETNRLAPEPDAYLQESGSILSDYLYALEPRRAIDSVIARQGQPEQSESLSN